MDTPGQNHYHYIDNYNGSLLLRVLSDLLSPPILAIPVFFAISLRVASAFSQVLLIFTICFFFQTLFPVIYLFTALRTGIISNIHLYLKEERSLVFPTLAVCYLLGYIVAVSLSLPELISGLMFTSGYLILLVWLINTQHKISIHAVGAAGLLTGLFFVFGPKLFFLELLLILIWWVRFKSNAHVTSQVLFGILLGHGITYLLLRFFL